MKMDKKDQRLRPEEIDKQAENILLDIANNESSCDEVMEFVDNWNWTNNQQFNGQPDIIGSELVNRIVMWAYWSNELPFGLKEPLERIMKEWALIQASKVVNQIEQGQ